MTNRTLRTATMVALGALVLPVPVLGQDETRIAVTIDENGCSPADLTAASGVVVFEVTNDGAEFGEFEIVLDNRVVDEVYLVPGFTSNLVTRLDGGTYETLCYSPTQPGGTLEVAGGAAPSAPPNTIVDQALLDQYRDEYQAWVREQSRSLTAQAGAFTSAILAGDLEAAKELYAPSRNPWERIEPVAELFTDMDEAIDFREDDYPLGFDDPAFRGYHRIEGILFAGRSGDLEALATQLQADVEELEARLAELIIEPRVMARGAGELMEEVAQTKMTGEEDRYSRADLWSIGSNIEGSKKIIDIYRPTLEDIAPEYLAQVDEAFAGVNEVMDAYLLEDGSGWEGFDKIEGTTDLTRLQARLAGLTEALAKLPGILGLEA